MSILWLIPVGLVLFGGIGLFVVFDRREAKREKLVEERLLASSQETALYFAEESRKERQAEEEMERLPWHEVRARCEKARGRPCECATKKQAGRRIYFAKVRSGEA